MSPKATNIIAWGGMSGANGTPGMRAKFNPVAEGDEQSGAAMLVPFRDGIDFRPDPGFRRNGFTFGL